MQRHGEPPYLECSSRGETRLSAFYARPTSLKGKSIEQAYQAMKVFEDGSTNLHWRAAKGRRATNADECAAQYRSWWREYILENPKLATLIMQATGLSDMFGGKGVCQATVLWSIREDLLNETDPCDDTAYPG